MGAQRVGAEARGSSSNIRSRRRVYCRAGICFQFGMALPTCEVAAVNPFAARCMQARFLLSFHNLLLEGCDGTPARQQSATAFLHMHNTCKAPGTRYPFFFFSRSQGYLSMQAAYRVCIFREACESSTAPASEWSTSVALVVLGDFEAA